MTKNGIWKKHGFEITMILIFASIISVGVMAAYFAGTNEVTNVHGLTVKVFQGSSDNFPIDGAFVEVSSINGYDTIVQTWSSMMFFGAYLNLYDNIYTVAVKAAGYYGQTLHNVRLIGSDNTIVFHLVMI